jgi:hypothetical protein
MPFDMGKALQAAIASALDSPNSQEESKAPNAPRLSTGRALLLGAGLLTAGRLAVSSRGRELGEALQRWVAEGDEEPEYEEGPEDEEYEEGPEAEEDEEFEDEEFDEDEDYHEGPEAEEDEESEDDFDEPEAEEDEEFDEDVDEEPRAEEDEEPRRRRGRRTRTRA